MRDILPIALLIYLAEVILLMPRIPLSLFLACLVGLVWKAISLRLGLASPPRVLLLIIGIMGLSLALIDAPRFWHRETATAGILIMALLFLLDRPSARQLMLTHSSFFGALVALLLTTGTQLPLLVYFGLTLLIFISLMLHHLPADAPISPWLLSRKLLKTALPVSAVMLPLYFLFPEVKPSPLDRAVTGLSDSIEPGKLAALARSDRLAFRARFRDETAVPRSTEEPFYWRVGVLEESSGMIWRRGVISVGDPLRPQRSEAARIYEIMTEPRLGSAIPLLEHTVYAVPVRKTEVGIFWDPSQRTYHSAHSILEVGASLDSSFVPSKVPAKPEPIYETSARVRRLANELRPLPVEEQIVRLLETFKSFSYTLEPGTLKGEDPLDEFLFEKKAGYCEHFAASFASLLQLAGTPARIVTGFSGGTALGESGFYLVLDGDAHAWTEVWTRDRWQRVDPSSVTAGRTFEQDQLRTWSAIPIAWLDYRTRQLGIKLRDLTQDIEMIWLLVFSLAGLLLILQVLRIWHRQKSETVWQHELDRLVSRLEQRGFAKKEPSETMASFFTRVGLALPEEKDRFERLRDSYDRLLFGPPATPEEGRALKEGLRELRRTIKHY